MGENGSWKGFQLHNHFKLVLSYRDGLQLAGHSVDISASICMQVRYLQHRVTSITFVSMARSLKQGDSTLLRRDSAIPAALEAVGNTRKAGGRTQDKGPQMVGACNLVYL